MLCAGNSTTIHGLHALPNPIRGNKWTVNNGDGDDLKCFDVVELI